MTAHEALQEARRRGIDLTPLGQILRLSWTEGALDEDLRRELVRHKPEILALLKEPRSGYPCARCRSFAFPEAGTFCYWCRKVRREA